MELAVITERNEDGSVKTIRSTVQPPSTNLQTDAQALDEKIGQAIGKLEARLRRRGLLTPDGRGSAEVWYEVGRVLHELADGCGVAGEGAARYRRWLWQSIDDHHGSGVLKRAKRGRSRSHLEYCYRLAQFPKTVAAKMKWSEWVYFFDSPTVREERRADRWIVDLVATESRIDRARFRRFVEVLNKRIRKKDTSVLSDEELFSHYRSAWLEALSQEPASV